MSTKNTAPAGNSTEGGADASTEAVNSATATTTTTETEGGTADDGGASEADGPSEASSATTSTQADATVDAPIVATVADDAGAGTDNGILPASEFEPSGAPVQIVPDVDPSHPAVDNDPRATTTFDQNRIDFNDPTLTGAEAVAKALASQAKGEDKEA